MTGVRIGYGDAKGVLTRDMSYLSGNVNVDILDRGEGMANANSDGNLFDQLIVLLTPLLEGSSPIRTKAELVDSTGARDPVRAEMIGVPNGEQFVLTGAGGFTR